MVLANIEPDVLPERYVSALVVEEFRRQDESAELEQRIAQTVGYMRARLNETLRVPKLARMVGVSQSHFFALFKQQTGFAPMDLFTRMRMKRACELLDSTALNIKEIAAALGYDDQFYFSRVFKSVNGISPSEYRVAGDQGNPSYPHRSGLADFMSRMETCLQAAPHPAI